MVNSSRVLVTRLRFRLLILQIPRCEMEHSIIVRGRCGEVLARSGKVHHTADASVGVLILHLVVYVVPVPLMPWSRAWRPICVPRHHRRM